MKTRYVFKNAAGDEVALDSNKPYQVTQLEDVTVLRDGAPGGEDEYVFTYLVVDDIPPRRPEVPHGRP